MTWRFNPLTGNSIAYLDDFQIIRSNNINKYELRVRFGVEHVFIPCFDFEKVMSEIKSGKWIA